MKRTLAVVFCLTIFILFSQTSYSQVDSIFEENYDTYSVGSHPNNVSNWGVFGINLITPVIQGISGNNWLQIQFNSTAGDVPPAWMSFGVIQLTPWSNAKDFTDATIEFDIRTDLVNAVGNVLAVEIAAVCNETGTVETFRIPDSELLSLPSAAQGWGNVQVDVTELTFNQISGHTPDLTQVEKVQLFVLQTVTDIVAGGLVDIDNFKAAGVDTTQTTTTIIIEENYNSYQVGSDPNLNSDWFVFGLERISQVVQGDSGDNWMDVSFNSPAGRAPAWCSFGLAQIAPWSVLKDFDDAIIKLDIKTNLAQAVPNVMAFEVFAVCNETGLIESFRIPDANLISLPSSAEGWVSIEVDISELTSNTDTWKTPDYSQIEKIQVLVLQTVTDMVAAGTLSIDNLKVEVSGEPGGGGGVIVTKKDEAISFLKTQIGPVGILDSFIEDGVDYSYTYDNAMCAMAFISEDDFVSARTILDAYLYTITPEQGGGFLHRYNSSNGNPAYGFLFAGANTYLLQAMNLYYLETQDTRYNVLAQQIADFLISIQDTDGGIPGLPQAAWKSTENNLGALSAIHNFGIIHGLQYYIDKASLIRTFLTTECWNGTRFLAGKNDAMIITDVQALGTMVLGPDYSNGAYWIEAYTANTQIYDGTNTVIGFDLNTDQDTVWTEGTLQETLAFSVAGDTAKYEYYKSEAEKLTNFFGAFYQASNVGSTGYGDDFVTWCATGPTAWYVLVANEDNALGLLE